MRLLIVGTLKGQLTTATKIAMDNGASVVHAEGHDQAMGVLRGGKGADLLLVDVALDIRDLVMRLEAEHIHVPIVACGITTDARAAVAAIHAGAKEYIPLPPDPELIAAVLAAVANDCRDLIYRDEAMGKVVKLAQQIAGSDASVMITGESGTGKEVLARYVHTRSNRAKKPFISINCAAIPEHLLESELFGHEKGAFTGAIARRIGKFEEATGGTLLLDEISRNGCAAAVEAAARHSGARHRPRRRHQAGAGRHPHHRDLEPQSVGRRARRHVPRGSAVPSERRQSEDPAAARSPGRHSRTGAAFRQEICRRQWRAGASDLRRGAARAHRQSLAGQRPRAGKHHPPFGADGQRRRDRRRCDPDPGRRSPRSREDRRRPWPTRPWPPKQVTRALVGRTVADVERDLILETLKHCLGNRTHAANILGISIRTLRNKLNEYADGGLPITPAGAGAGDYRAVMGAM